MPKGIGYGKRGKRKKRSKKEEELLARRRVRARK